MDTTPGNSGRAMVTTLEVTKTPQGDQLLLEQQKLFLVEITSGKLLPWRPRPEDIEGDDEDLDALNLPVIFHTEAQEIDEDDIFEADLAEEVAVDSGSDDEEETEKLSPELLQQLLTSDEEEYQDPGDLGKFQWIHDFSIFRGTREEFAEDAGAKIEGTSPSGLFTQIWDQPLMEMIAKKTNKYARDNIALHFESETGLPPNSRLRQWVDTSVEELYRFLIVIMVMGLCFRGCIAEYWTTGITKISCINRLLSADRFLLLLRNIHFADNDAMTARGAERKIAKIKPLIEYLNSKFKAVYTPRRELSLAESLLLWKRNLTWLKCVRTKAAGFGIKSHQLCEAVSGYVLKVMLYTGKGTTMQQSMYGFTSSTDKIILNLVEDYLGKGHTLYMDSFYNSISLFRFLKTKNTDVVGTLNREGTDTPYEIKCINESAMQRGSVVSQHCGDVSVVSWKALRLVTTVSTCHNANMVQGCRSGPGNQVPEVIHDYNRYMVGFDQKIFMYVLERKRGIKWYIKVFRRFLNISIANSFIIYCSNSGERKMTYNQFIYKLVHELIEQFGQNVQSPTRKNNSCARLDRSLRHYPEHEEVTQDRTSKQDRFKRGPCVRCSAKREIKPTNIRCSQCKVFLCVGVCWREFHTLENI